MARRTRSRRRKQESSDESSDETESDTQSSDSESESSGSEISGLSSSDSDSSESESESNSEDDEKSEFDETQFPDENKRKTEEEVRELIRDAKVMKYEQALLEEAGIDSYESMRNCDEKTLKRIGMGYSDRERLLKAFRTHIEGIVEKNREKWERKQELKHESKKKSKKKGGKTSKSKTKSSKSRSKNKSSKKGSSKKASKSKSKTSSKSKSKSAKSKTPKIDEDEALRKLDEGWSGKKQAWADYKQHEARVAELVEFYDEIGKKRTNAEEHARKLLVSYPGGIHKLVIALDKKYHHIPYGWEDLLDEALRLAKFDKTNESESSDNNNN